MLDSTPTARVKQKPSTPDEIVELKPPDGQGMSGTALIPVAGNSVLIEELLRLGYTKVDKP